MSRWWNFENKGIWKFCEMTVIKAKNISKKNKTSKVISTNSNS